MDNFKNAGVSATNVSRKIDEKANDFYNKKQNNPKTYNDKLKQKTPGSISSDIYDGIDDDIDDLNDPNYNQMYNDFDDNYGVGIQPAQKPESFHHYILENQYKELEKSIRGYKDVHNKEKREWEIKRKDIHCFTDEESEDIIRMVQSLLATDIKLSFINKEVYGIKAMGLYNDIKKLFREIAEYRYGRYSHNADGTPKEGGFAMEQAMKWQNFKIFTEVVERINANYSRAISGTENRVTHQSVRGQESLQSSDRMSDVKRRYI